MRGRRGMCVGLMVLLMFLFIAYTISMLLDTDLIDDYHDISYHDYSHRLHGNRQSRKQHREAEERELDDIRDFVVIYNLTVPYEADFKCVTMKSDPPTPVCLYNQWNDMYISHDLEFTGMWEGHVMSDLQEALKRDASLGLIDIGANIGVYSLLAAKMRRTVVAVDPNRDSLLRLHRAAVIAGTQKHITAVNNAVSDFRGVATLRRSGNNQGNTRIEPGYQDCIGSCPKKVNVILLDDIRFIMSADRAVLKIDAQGHEHLAFLHCSKLLDTINIPYIYMEWIVMRDLYVASNVTTDSKTAVQAMVDTLLNRHYRPHRLNHEGATELEEEDWGNWPNDVVWRHLPTRTEYHKLIRNHFLHWP